MLRSTRLLWAVALGLLLFTYLRWLAPAVSPYAGGSDTSGYVWSARLFREGTLSVPIAVPKSFPIERVDRQVFMPLGGSVRPGTMTLVPTYPTGLPLHIAAAAAFLPEESAVKTVLLFAAAGALVLLFLLAREAGLPRLWAAAASVTLALSPLFLFIAIQPFSDVLATLWAEAAVLCAWRSRRRPAFAWLAGASLGVATLVRPTNLVLALPVLAAMPAGAAIYARLIGGGLPFAAFVSVYQAWAYGNPLTSGYGGIGHLFAWRAVPQTLWHYVVWGPQLASWIVVFAPAAAWAWRGPLARWRLVAGAWLLAIFGTYALYLLTSETWWYMRFVLPGFPILIVAGLAGLRVLSQEFARRMPAPKAQWAIGTASVLVVALCLFALVRSPVFGVYRTIKSGERTYQDALKVIAMDEGPPHPVLMMQLSGATNYYRPDLRYLRYDSISPDAWEAIRAWQRQEGVPIGAAVYDFEREKIFGPHEDRLPCNWQPRGHYHNIQFWECPP